MARRRKSVLGDVPRLQRSDLIVILDFDGTIAPIVRRPELARMIPQARRALVRLARRKIPVAIVSGRSMPDLRRLVGKLPAVLAANHGAEIAGRKFYGSVEPIRKAEARLRKKYGHIRGIQFENKGPILAIHYRNVAPRERPTIRGRHGKMVTEIRLPGLPTKFDAVRRLAKGRFVIYFGDDRTDLDAFRAIRRGVRVWVGRGRHGDVRLRGPREVAQALNGIADGSWDPGAGRSRRGPGRAGSTAP